jgi:hypothetical protein
MKEERQRWIFEGGSPLSRVRGIGVTNFVIPSAARDLKAEGVSAFCGEE